MAYIHPKKKKGEIGDRVVSRIANGMQDIEHTQYFRNGCLTDNAREQEKQNRMY